MDDIIAIGSSQPVVWETMKDSSGDSVTTASVSGTLKNGATTLDTFSLTHTSAGTYVGYLDENVTGSLTDCEEYTIELTATVGAYTEFRKLNRIATYRGEV
ncbi:hypothetical protein Pla110_33000 [Polystyrenella longa]|uniref:Uncharacterized protein n=1 Tax=Polystyrenella longa TaxID=2528007 RepID=A0A518CQR2_9PLAN|nr:hypothetical protein [Polystyrenella longa]QDU81558.1 hypothetical protein Pla110_33000 [Polystyrenella longa]